MAQNVTIAGAEYSSVPAVNLNKTGGGTATYIDTSDANAGAGDIRSGKTAYVAGSKVTGSLVPGITPTGTLTLTANTAGTNCTNYATVVVALPEYDGSVS